jgi:copper chaperone CopZ
MKAFSLLVVVFILFSSCEKRIEFNLKNAEPVLNVDASIENGKDPVVVLNKSLNFFSTISIQEISNSLIKDAKVFISNGVATQELNRIDVPLPGAISYSYYSLPPAKSSIK